MKRLRFSVTSTFLIALTLITWAASASGGAVHSHFNRRGIPRAPQESAADDNKAAFFSQSARPQAANGKTRRLPSTIPAPVNFRESEERGLLAQVWVNGSGPYLFAIDTGAGATILSPRVAGAARVSVERNGREIRVGGLSGMSVGGGRKAFVDNLAIGFRENFLPSKGLIIIAGGLPADLDGILDPTEAFSPLGYIIDFPRGTLGAFDPHTIPVRANDVSTDGAVVQWLHDSSSRRPFVMLGGARRALLDTGSAFGLAVTEDAARALGISTGEGREREATRDLAGGYIASRRIRPATVHLGALALRGVPTDFLVRAEAGAPVLLGRDALRPFRLTFDPLNRLIRIEP